MSNREIVRLRLLWNRRLINYGWRRIAGWLLSNCNRCRMVLPCELWWRMWSCRYQWMWLTANFDVAIKYHMKSRWQWIWLSMDFIVNGILLIMKLIVNDFVVNDTRCYVIVSVDVIVLFNLPWKSMYMYVSSLFPVTFY